MDGGNVAAGSRIPVEFSDGPLAARPLPASTIGSSFFQGCARGSCL